MTKLNLLGAQRVKALTEILERRFKDVIKEVESEELPIKVATEILAERKNAHSELQQIKDIEKDINSLSRMLLAEVGIRVEFQLRYGHYSALKEVREDLHNIQRRDIDKTVAILNRELEDRKSQLWLVETLEQAQEIVNRPIEY